MRELNICHEVKICAARAGIYKTSAVDSTGDVYEAAEAVYNMATKICQDKETLAQKERVINAQSKLIAFLVAGYLGVILMAGIFLTGHH